MPNAQKKLSAIDLSILKKRLSVEHLTQHTLVFSNGDSPKMAALKFKAYWIAWIENDLRRLFAEVENHREMVLEKSKSLKT